MSNEKKLSQEEIQLLEAQGLMYSGFDKKADKHKFVKSLVNSGVATNDPKMVCREWYNSSKHTIKVELEKDIAGQYIYRTKAGSKPRLAEFETAILKPGDFLFCVHGYYKFSHLNGSALEGDVQLIMNFGTRKFKGNTLPDNPEFTPRIFKNK